MVYRSLSSDTSQVLTTQCSPIARHILQNCRQSWPGQLRRTPDVCKHFNTLPRRSHIFKGWDHLSNGKWHCLACQDGITREKRSAKKHEDTVVHVQSIQYQLQGHSNMMQHPLSTLVSPGSVAEDISAQGDFTPIHALETPKLSIAPCSPPPMDFLSDNELSQEESINHDDIELDFSMQGMYLSKPPH